MATDVTSGFKPGDDQAAVGLLQQWDGGVLSDALFIQITAMIPLVGVEVVVLRWRKVIETLLIPRPVDDRVWPGMMHTPGTIFRWADFQDPAKTAIQVAFERLQEGELDHRFLDPPRLATVTAGTGERGPGIGIIYWAELAHEAPIHPGHEWYPVDQLYKYPRFIQSQWVFVKAAANHFYHHKLIES